MFLNHQLWLYQTHYTKTNVGTCFHRNSTRTSPTHYLMTTLLGTFEVCRSLGQDAHPWQHHWRQCFWSRWRCIIHHRSRMLRHVDHHVFSHLTDTNARTTCSFIWRRWRTAAAAAAAAAVWNTPHAAQLTERNPFWGIGHRRVQPSKLPFINEI